MDNDYLIHHGVKGMKWGVRRYQDKNGRLTEEGKRRRLQGNRTKRAWETKPKVDDIISTMNKNEQDKLGLGENGYLSFEDGAYLVKRILIEDGDTPVAFFDILDDEVHYNLALGVRSDEKYRNKGYATKAAKKGMDWYERNKVRIGDKPVVWGVRTDNEPSIKIAKKLGFEFDESSYSNDDKWVNYVKK